MKQYWANAIGQYSNTSTVTQFFTYNSSLSLEKAKEVIDDWRKHFIVYSAWIECDKELVYHESYVDSIGNVKKPE